MRYNTKRRNTISKRKQGKKGYNKKKSVKKMKLKRSMRGGGKAPKDCDNYTGIPLDLNCYKNKIDNFTISDDAKVITANTGKSYKLKFNFNGPLEIKDEPLLIKENAFSNQETLTSLTLPTSLIKIGEEAFKNCTMLNQITFTETSSLKEIGNSAFSWCTKLQSINLPRSVRKIGDGAFHECNNLTGEIKIPAGVLEIGEHTFFTCKSIKSIELPISVRKIGKSAFNGCAELTKFNFSIDEDSNTSKKKTRTSKLTEIGESAFSGCSKLTEFQIPNKVLNIGTTAFMNSGITSLDIPSSLLEIGAHAFFECLGLIKITVRENSNLCSIGKHAFEGCTSLSTVDLSNSELLYLDYQVFKGCTKLKEITLPKNLKGVHENAFENCEGIKVKNKPETIDIKLFGRNASAV